MANLAARQTELGTEMLVFKNLYDDVWGLIVKPKETWQRPNIIMPQGFLPEPGRTYECRVRETMNGIFNYNGIDYSLSYASWVETASGVDLVEHFVQRDKTPKNNPFAEALKGIDRSKLPQVEIVTLEVQNDPKNGGLMFAPQYLDNDPHANRLPTMRFFHPISKVDLALGKTYHARIQRVQQTGQETRRKALILRVFVEII